VTDVLDFSQGLDAGVDRAQLIEEAAMRLDAAARHLAPGGKDGTSETGDIAREFADDEASLSRPRLHRVDLSALDPARISIPVSTQELTRRASFYWLSFPVSLFSRPGRGFNRIEMKVEFNPGDDGVRPVTFDVLPDEAWATKFQVGSKLALGVNAELQFDLTVPDGAAQLIGLPASGGAAGQAAAETGLVLGPFTYVLRVPEVVHNGSQHSHVFWRLDGGSFVQQQDPGFQVILRLPDGVQALEVRATMQATRYYNLLQSRLKEAIQDLPAALRSFFVGGTPIRARDEWTLTEEL